MLARLANLAAHRPKRVLAAAFAFVVVAGVVGGPVAGLLSTEGDFADPGSQSTAARERLERATGREAGLAYIAIISPRSASRADQVRRTLSSTPGVAEAFGFAETGDRRFVSRDGRSTYVAAVLNADADRDAANDRIEASLGKAPSVKLGGPALAGPAVGDQVSKDLARAELLAFPLLFLLSLIVFRGVIAALLPLFVGTITIFGTFLGLRLVNEATLLSVFALNLAIGLGLGLAIDYALFIVSRYREEMAAGGPGPEALARTLQTAGRTVLFSSMTVAAAMLSLLVFPQRFLYSMGVSGAITAIVAAVAALTALPALLMLLGARVQPRRGSAARAAAAEGSSGFWYRLSHGVMRRPVAVAVATAGVLLLVGLPFTQIRFTGVDATVLPRDLEVRQVDDIMRSEFTASAAVPVHVAVAAPRSAQRAMKSYAGRLRALGGVARVAPAAYAGRGTWQVEVEPAGAALAGPSLELVRAIRATPAPGGVLVGGESADFVDQQAGLGGRLPLALTILCLTTLAILFLMTGSAILPVKALVMNFLTLSAAFGLLVLIFQDGRLEGVLGYTSQGGIEATQPLVLLALVFGLSTDYGVFLLSRIKEAHDDGATNDEAVAVGLQRTGRIVTAAALLFIVAIGAFATSKIIFIKEVGLGTALAVGIDATIIRALLVPALMKLLGERNWWAPGPLRRLHARVGVDETPSPTPA
jgi:uncharacterized membrane protein YdfJ with MMPL/SSD domain